MQVPVRLRVHIMAIDNVNTVQQQFYCKAWIQLKWYVQQEHLDDTETRNVAVGDTWKPDLFIQNAAGPVSVTNTMREITDEAGRRGILLSQVIEGQFSEPFELRHFPLDQQRLHLRFAVWNCAQTFAAVAGSGHADIVGCTALSSLTPVVQKAADQGADAVAKMSSEASTDSQPGISGRSGKQQQLLPFKRRVEFWRGSCQVYKEGFVQQDSWHLHEHVVVKQVRQERPWHQW